MIAMEISVRLHLLNSGRTFIHRSSPTILKSLMAFSFFSLETNGRGDMKLIPIQIWWSILLHIGGRMDDDRPSSCGSAHLI